MARSAVHLKVGVCIAEILRGIHGDRTVVRKSENFTGF